MATSTVALSASLQIRGTSHEHVRGHKLLPNCQVRAIDTKQASHLVTAVETAATSNILDDNKVQQQGTLHVLKVDGLSATGGNMSTDADSEASGIKFTDTRWKKGTWDLNMFVKDGKMDWDSLIAADEKAKRRKFLQSFPEASTNDEPVLFRSSIIPWWAWIARSHLPEAELLNGRAAMVGFFMAYLVDILTGLDMVGQTGSFICKTGLLITVFGVILLRRTKDFENLKKLADEATFYDKQWQASSQDQEVK